MAAGFIGEVEVRWLSGAGPDRDMKTLKDFSFRDGAGKVWKVPKGAVINGASIPQVFWTTFGSPYTDDYRRASVVHDHYCDVRTETWQATHRMFHEACVAGGVAPVTAKLMYAAVNTFGPKWPAPVPGAKLAKAAARMVRPFADADFAALRHWIEHDDPALAEIDARIAAMAPVIELPAS